MSEGSLTPIGFAEENEQAEKSGLQVRLADNTHLLLDLDTPDMIARYNAMLPKFQKLFGSAVKEVYESKSGPGHLHVVIELALAIPVGARLALQAVLGSDPVRELLSVRRLMNGVAEPSRLFRKP